MHSRIKKLYIILSIGIFSFIGYVCMVNFSVPTKKLRVGISPWPGYEILFLARSRGYINDSSIRLIELSSATDVIQAIRNDALDAATLTLDETLTLLASGVDLTIVAVMDISSGADAILAQPKYKSLLNLKGKDIGVEITAVGAIVLDGALEQVGMQASDFTIVPLPINKHVQAYAEKKVDAIVTFEPVKTYLLSQGAVSLFDSSQIPGRIIDVLVVRSSILKKNINTVCSMVKAQFQALEYFQSQPEKASQMMAPRLQMSAQNFLKSYRDISLIDQLENRKLLVKSDSSLHVFSKQLSGLMLDHKLLNRTPNISSLIDSRCVEENYLE